MHINFIANVLEYGKKRCDLDCFRQYMLKNHDTLCSNMFIKSIIKNGSVVFTYDWLEICEIAKHTKIIDAFYQKNKELFK